MGLSIDCQVCGNVRLFHGSYAAFHWFRINVCKACGYAQLFVDNDTTYDAAALRHAAPPLAAFIEHSDETGILTVEELEQLKPYLERALQVAEGLPNPKSWAELSAQDICRFLDGLEHCVAKQHRALFA